jgi:hypothetical protein
MKPRKNVFLIMLLGLLLAAFVAGIAQTPGQGDQKKSEACCSMDSCCCNGGSCPMKEEGPATAEAKDGCCNSSCCSGDSCDLKAKDGAANHAEHEGCCCCGDSCDMKKHDAKNHGAKDSCCKVKHKAKQKV